MNSLKKASSWVSVAVGVLGGWLSRDIGSWNALLITVIVLAVLDYLTSVIQSIYNKQISSDIGLKGILKKALMFIVITAAYFIQMILSEEIPLRKMVILFFIANEGISILKHAAKFIPIPEQLQSALQKLTNKVKKQKPGEGGTNDADQGD